LESQLKLLIERLKQLTEPPQDQHLIEKVTSQDFDWKQNIALVCYSCGVTASFSNMSTFWEGDLERLAKLLSSSPAFPEGVTSVTLRKIRHQLRLGFEYEEEDLDMYLGVDHKCLTGSKRSSHEELNPAKRTKVIQPVERHRRDWL